MEINNNQCLIGIDQKGSESEKKRYMTLKDTNSFILFYMLIAKSRVDGIKFNSNNH